MSDWQERLSEAMEARGISGGELARRAGFTAQYVNSMRSKERGGRLTLDTAQRLAQALGVTVEWLTAGTGRRERLSDVFPIYAEGAPESSMMLSERYASRAEAIALYGAKLAPEVIAALRAAVPPEPGVDPGRQFWIDHARALTIDHARINADPVFAAERASEAVPPTEGRVKAPPSSRGSMEAVPPTQGRIIKEPGSAREPQGDGLPPATPRRKKAR